MRNLSCKRLTAAQRGFVTTSFTFRIPTKQRERLRSKAKALGKTESKLLREILDRELESRPLADRIAHMQGALEPSTGEPDEWEKTLRRHNWRP
jgi:hypothetical protein